MSNLQTISIFTENNPGVLHRITVIFTRRKINIESLTVSETETKGISRFTICSHGDDETIAKLVKQIARIVEVRNISVRPNDELIYKEIALFRVSTNGAEQRSKVEELSRRYGASMVNTTAELLVLEKTGSEEEVNSLYLLLEPYGIKEFVRSGRIAINK